ncbi:unnamed protein product [Prunus armeniaca]
MKIVLSCADGSGEDYYKLLPSGPASLPDEQVPISHNDDNVYWKELLMIVYVWVAFLIVQILKFCTTKEAFLGTHIFAYRTLKYSPKDTIITCNAIKFHLSNTSAFASKAP